VLMLIPRTPSQSRRRNSDLSVSGWSTMMPRSRAGSAASAPSSTLFSKRFHTRLNQHAARNVGCSGVRLPVGKGWRPAGCSCADWRAERRCGSRKMYINGIIGQQCSGGAVQRLKQQADRRLTAGGAHSPGRRMSPACKEGRPPPYPPCDACYQAPLGRSG
jgi:hypothetical protein